MIGPGALERCIADLPPFSSAALEAMKLLDDGDRTDYSRIAGALERDPALVARALRLANSPFYGLAEQIRTVREACFVLGNRALRQLVTAAAVMTALGKPADTTLWHRLWLHATATAVAARTLAGFTGAEPEPAATAGLLHDLGRLVLVRHFPEYLDTVALHAEREGLHLVEAERAVLGLDHGQVGARVATRWHLPSDLIAAIGGHHSPDVAAEPLVDLVHVADVLCQALDSEPHDAPVSPLSEGAWGRLGVDWAQVRQVFGDVEARRP